MRWIAIAAFVLGCSKSRPPAQPVVANTAAPEASPAPVEPPPPAPAGDAEAAIRDMTRIQERMCACKDPPCVERVGKEMEALAQRAANVQADDDQTRRATEIVTRMMECATKVQQAP